VKEVLKGRSLSGIKRMVGDILQQSPLNVYDNTPTEKQSKKRRKKKSGNIFDE